MGSSYDIDRSASSVPLHELDYDLAKSLLEVSAIESTGGFRFPVDLECNRNQVFFVAHKIMNYHVDRMAYGSAQEGMIREGKDVFAALDIAQYQRYTFSMYSGDVQRVTMRFRNTMMNADIDKFGKLGYIKEVDKAHFEVTAPRCGQHAVLWLGVWLGKLCYDCRT